MADLQNCYSKLHIFHGVPVGWPEGIWLTEGSAVMGSLVGWQLGWMDGREEGRVVGCMLG